MEWPEDHSNEGLRLHDVDFFLLAISPWEKFSGMVYVMTLIITMQQVWALQGRVQHYFLKVVLFLLISTTAMQLEILLCLDIRPLYWC